MYEISNIYLSEIVKIFLKISTKIENIFPLSVI